jgi:fructokinase
VRFSSEARTALAFVSLRADGDREFMFYRHPSDDTLFEPAEVDAAAIRPALRDHQPDQRAVAQCHAARHRTSQGRRLNHLVRPQPAPRAVAGS